MWYRENVIGKKNSWWAVIIKVSILRSFCEEKVNLGCILTKSVNYVGIFVCFLCVFFITQNFGVGLCDKRIKTQISVLLKRTLKDPNKTVIS